MCARPRRTLQNGHAVCKRVPLGSSMCTTSSVHCKRRLCHGSKAPTFITKPLIHNSCKFPLCFTSLQPPSPAWHHQPWDEIIINLEPCTFISQRETLQQRGDTDTLEFHCPIVFIDAGWCDKPNIEGGEAGLSSAMRVAVMLVGCTFLLCQMLVVCQRQPRATHPSSLRRSLPAWHSHLRACLAASPCSQIYILAQFSFLSVCALGGMCQGVAVQEVPRGCLRMSSAICNS